MKFLYKAVDKNNEVQEGEFEADGLNEVLKYLALNELRPIYVKKPRLDFFWKKVELIRPSITVLDKIFLTRYLALLLKSGTDTLQSINLLISSFQKPAVRRMLGDIKRNLEKGLPFYKAFEDRPEYFSRVFVGLMRAGEKSGTLVDALESINRTLDNEYNYKRQIKSALTYPIILVCLSFLILIILVAFVLPSLANVILSSGFELPLFSRIVFATGLFLRANILIILGVVFVLFVSLFLFFIKTKSGRTFSNNLVKRIPVVKNIIYKYALGRFASVLSLLIHSGVPIIEAVEITSQTISYLDIKMALEKIAREDLATGKSLGESLKKSAVFPPILSGLILISEKAGKIDETTKTMGEFYNNEVGIEIKSFLNILEPLILVIMGLLIAFIAISIIVPIYQMVGGLA